MRSTNFNLPCGNIFVKENKFSQISVPNRRASKSKENIRSQNRDFSENKKLKYGRRKCNYGGERNVWLEKFYNFFITLSMGLK